MSECYLNLQTSPDQIYPSGPATVPENLTRQNPAYKKKAWLAMSVLALFMALYFFMAGWFSLKAWRLIAGAFTGGKDSFVGILVGLCAAFLAVFMLKALFFVKHGGKVDDIEITAEQQPNLFEFLHRLADEAGAPRPHRVFLSPRVNAAVFYDLSLFNLIFPSKKNLEIGLGLVNVLTLGEFKAVCAHEFGHFAQKSMAVGRWVYMAQQIAAHIVAKRDALDKFLRGLSHFDLRIAWVGWLLSIIVWSIRSLTESAFDLVVLAQRALSRQMEMHADLVAVSLTGSDALIHALHRLNVADDAMDRAMGFVSSELANGRATRDLFAAQSRMIEHVKMLFNDPDYGEVPPLPRALPEAHRVFKAELAQPPLMWSTHPLNHEREENSKQIYVQAPLDCRSAWVLFENAGELREQVTARLINSTEAVPATTEESLKALDADFDREFLKPSYRGVYLGRSVVRNAAQADGLYGALVDSAIGDLDSLYPESLAADFAQLRILEKEKSLLESLHEGVFSATGGVIRHRGRALRRQDLQREIGLLQQEIAVLQEKVCDHDRRCRTAHRVMAAKLKCGWEAHLVGLAKVLHYADHSEANIRDAQGSLNNVVAVVIAERRVGSRGLRRVLSAADDVYAVLEQLFSQSDKVLLDSSLISRLDTESWKEFLGELKLLPPNKENINDWLNVVDSWVDHAAGALSVLRRCALEQLLITEAQVGSYHRERIVPEVAPAPSEVPAGYMTLVPGQERKLQKRLGWWGRFQTADGIIPAVARLVVACSIVGAVLGMGGSVGNTTVTIYNGLSREVKVDIGNSSVTVSPFSSEEVSFQPDSHVGVRAMTVEGAVIEAFDADVRGSYSNYVYNVACASPLVEWTASYGSALQQPERMLGAPRWSTTNADVLFKEPPDQVETKGGGATRDVLTGFGDGYPGRVLSLLKDNSPEQSGVILAHSRWDSADSRYIMFWMAAGSKLDGFPKVLADRLRSNPKEVISLRFEQDTASAGAHENVCKRHRILAVSSPENADFQYLAVRCIEDKAARDKAFLEAYKKQPQNCWIASAAAYTLAGQGRWSEALAGLETVFRKNSATSVVAAVDIARIRRLLAGNNRVAISDLKAKSESLRIMQSLESGEGVENSAMKAYSELAVGRIGQALTMTKGTPAETRLLRLAAASEGADPKVIERALALSPDQGIDDDTVWAALGLAARKKHVLTPYMDIIRKNAGKEDADSFLRFFEQVRKHDLDAAEKALDGFSPVMRGQAYCVGVILLGNNAPVKWRAGAKLLLFASERPYFI